MKKIIALLTAGVMLVSFAACGTNADKDSAEATTETTTAAPQPETMGQSIYATFKDAIAANPQATAEELAAEVLKNEKIEFMPTSAPVVDTEYIAGFREGFSNFKEAAVFAPMIGVIPFMGYIFVLEDGADVDAFKAQLKENCNPRWNVCTEADETVIESEGNVVFFLMCSNESEEDMGEDADVEGLPEEITLAPDAAL